MYVDRNAMMVGAFIRAAALFDDMWLRDFALKSLEAVIVPAYKPGDGVAHVAGADGGHGVRGLLTDQIHVASALIWAHAATGQLPYSMLAAEVLQFAIRTMWDDAAGGFRDRVDCDDPARAVRAQLPCRVRARSARRAHGRRGLSGSRPRDSAIAGRRISRARSSLARRMRVAVREVFDRRPPAGLELSPVDWQLGIDGLRD